MTFQEFLEATGLSSTAFWGIVVFLTSIGVEVIPKIKWNPWSTLIKWLGTRFNAHLDAKLDTVRGEIKVLDKKVDYVEKELMKHVAESEKQSLEDTRRDILNFCNACMNDQKHTKEQFDYMIRKCDVYEKYIRDNDIENGVVKSAIKEIRRIYDKCIQEHSFLKEGQ